MKPGKTGIARVTAAFGYSMKGLKAAWQHEAAFRQELVACTLLIPLTFFVAQSLTQAAILLISLGLILIAELANSAIEAVVDRFGGEIHVLSGRAKDIGSAMVFVAIALAGAVWGLVIYQNYFSAY